jgi:hypothetical protein
MKKLIIKIAAGALLIGGMAFNMNIEKTSDANTSIIELNVKAIAQGENGPSECRWHNSMGCIYRYNGPLCMCW